jgi:hypothetical protein
VAAGLAGLPVAWMLWRRRLAAPAAAGAGALAQAAASPR